MSTARKTSWLQPGFLIVVITLAVSAAGLNGVVAMMKLKFIKSPVPLKQDLSFVPERLGDWVQVSKDEPLDKELQESLATDKYIFRDYVNTRLVTPMDMARFDNKTSTERKQITAQIQRARPDAVLSLAVTYYTGKVDTVAHIPERCYVADGFEVTTAPETLQWDMGANRLGKSPADPQTIGVRFLDFEDQTGSGKIARRVAYFFFVNGHYESDSLRVRQILENLRSTHGFYSKVELMSIMPDHDQCAKVMGEFLRSAMPEIEKCYPDWNSVEHPGVKQ